MESKLDEILRTRQFPGLAGISTGPGSGENQVCFDRPNTKLEVKRCLAQMENDGKLKDPKMMEFAKTKWNAVKDLGKTNIDYGKVGTDLDRHRSESVD